MSSVWLTDKCDPAGTLTSHNGPGMSPLESLRAGTGVGGGGRVPDPQCRCGLLGSLLGDGLPRSSHYESGQQASFSPQLSLPNKAQGAKWGPRLAFGARACPPCCAPSLQSASSTPATGWDVAELQGCPAKGSSFSTQSL